MNFRNYTNIPGITPDYYAVRDFLVESGRRDYTYARWDWMITHPNLDAASLSRIGLWEDSGKIVALATFDCTPDDIYLIVLSGYELLLPEMIRYTEKNLYNQDEYRLVIPDNDMCFRSVAAELGYVTTPKKEYTAAFYPDETSTDYTLPDGFGITDMSKFFDLYQYGRVLWKGFNHELNGEGAYTPTLEDKSIGKASMLRANVDLSLKIVAIAPTGEFAAYCGMWYDKKAGFAVIEPVACVPEYRRMGLGKAVVLEGIRRTRALGARLAVVGSSQQFYYSIGLRPYLTATKWQRHYVCQNL